MPVNRKRQVTPFNACLLMSHTWRNSLSLYSINWHTLKNQYKTPTLRDQLIQEEKLTSMIVLWLKYLILVGKALKTSSWKQSKLWSIGINETRIERTLQTVLGHLRFPTKTTGTVRIRIWSLCLKESWQV